MAFSITQMERVGLKIPIKYEGKRIKDVKQPIIMTILSSIKANNALYDLGYGLIGRIANTDQQRVLVFSGAREVLNPLFHRCHEKKT